LSDEWIGDPNVYEDEHDRHKDLMNVSLEFIFMPFIVLSLSCHVTRMTPVAVAVEAPAVNDTKLEFAVHTSKQSWIRFATAL